MIALTFLSRFWVPLTVGAIGLAGFLYVSYLQNKVDTLDTQLTVVTQALEVQTQKLEVTSQLQVQYQVRMEEYIKQLNGLNEDLQTTLDVVQSATEEEKGKEVSRYIKNVIERLQ